MPKGDANKDQAASWRKLTRVITDGEIEEVVLLRSCQCRRCGSWMKTSSYPSHAVCELLKRKTYSTARCESFWVNDFHHIINMVLEKAESDGTVVRSIIRGEVCWSLPKSK